MKITTALVLFWNLVLCCVACHSPHPPAPPAAVTDLYEVHLPAGPVRAVLVLFGGYGEQASDIWREFNVLAPAQERGVAVVFLNYSHYLWLEDEVVEQLAVDMQKPLGMSQLRSKNVYLGGFSSGGNVALQLASYLAKPGVSDLKIQGVFAVDPPIDLAARYRVAAAHVNDTTSNSTSAESAFLLDKLGGSFGDPAHHLSLYERYSVCTLESGHLGNLKRLITTHLRLYTEPDATWWPQERGLRLEETNAFLIQQLCGLLKQEGFSRAECIETHKKGYRANGDRHPHSWSIVDVPDLLVWVLKVK